MTAMHQKNKVQEIAQQPGDQDDDDEKNEDVNPTTLEYEHTVGKEDRQEGIELSNPNELANPLISATKHLGTIVDDYVEATLLQGDQELQEMQDKTTLLEKVTKNFQRCKARQLYYIWM
ncbi:hypothetical protein ACH5RR_013445 [Cinchona calisaya]|uniref:t-SNARE coiled-coil homology domain-containing protein n=1 Tax=Cinchona calisaya TaxID=153742 RepID=A0ABD3A0J4_9GENT